MNRLFLPLTGMWHNLFKCGYKTWELRKVSNRFNEKTVLVGREVELRRGYKYDPVFGTITDVVVVDTWDDLSENIKNGIFPQSETTDEHLKFLMEYLEKSIGSKLIAFRIELSKNN